MRLMFFLVVLCIFIISLVRFLVLKLTFLEVGKGNKLIGVRGIKL